MGCTMHGAEAELRHGHAGVLGYENIRFHAGVLGCENTRAIPCTVQSTSLSLDMRYDRVYEDDRVCEYAYDMMQ